MVEAFLHINIAQTLFAAIIILTKRPLNISDRILAFWLFFIMLLMVKKLAFLSYHEYVNTEWIRGRLIKISFPIFLYLYIKYLTGVYKRFQKIDLLHFLLFFILVLITAYYLITGQTINTNVFWKWNWFEVILSIAYYSAFIGYGVLIVKTLRKYARDKDDYYSFHNSNVDLKWINFIVVVFYLYFGVLAVNNLIDVISEIRLITNSIKMPIYALIIYTISFRGYNQTRLLAKQQNIDKEFESYQSSGLSKENVDHIQRKILKLMKQERPWLNPDLTVSDISAKTKIPKHHITQVLNKNLKKNFYTLINEFRSNEVIRLFGLQEFNDWKIEFIAYEAGFNSKSSFNNFFKKYTGKTPSEYRKGLRA